MESNTSLRPAPYHPASNGLAERAVQIVKKGLKKTALGSIQARLATTLMSYRLTPQSTTGISPAELLLGRQPRSRLDLLKPHTAEQVEKNQLRQKKQHDARARDRDLQPGDNVFVRNYHHGGRWLPGVIQRRTGPVSFQVKLTDGREHRCHQDQVRRRTVEVEIPGPPEELDVLVATETPTTPTPTFAGATATEAATAGSTIDPANPASTAPVPPAANPKAMAMTPPEPSRIHKECACSCCSI